MPRTAELRERGAGEANGDFFFVRAAIAESRGHSETPKAERRGLVDRKKKMKKEKISGASLIDLGCSEV